MKRLEAIIRGRVQLVMFRDFVNRNARSLGLVGRVKNLSDGTVWLVAEGEEEKLRTLLEKIKKGPPLARVENVMDLWKEPTGSYQDFQIVFYE